MDLLVLFIALLGLNILGLCCLGVGLLVTVPISGLAMAYVYRELKPKTVGCTGDRARGAAWLRRPV